MTWAATPTPSVRSVRYSSSSDSVPPVVIRFGPTDSTAVGTMEEDLAVMTYIIDRAMDRAGEDVPAQSMNIPLIYTSGGRSVRSMYLEGFGPLFMIKVNFPVHAPAEPKPEPAEKTSSEWEEAKQNLYGAQEVQWMTTSGVPYEAERVDLLKKHLLQALKNASNIRGVEPDEHITIAVFGSPAPSAVARGAGGGGMGAGFSAGVGDATLANTVEPFQQLPYGTRSGKTLKLERTALKGTVLTLRVKKSDVDAAAKGTLDPEAFAKTATVNTYAGNGYGLTSVNSWLRSSSSYRAK